jgi:hypothetical protein
MKEDNCMMFIKVLFTLMLVTMVSAGYKGHTGRPKSKTDIDTSRLELIKVKEKEIRQYYASWCDVGLDGIAVMPTGQQEKYTDIAIELLYEALSKAGYKPVTSQKAAAAIRKYFNVDITEKNCLLHRYGIHRYVCKSEAINDRDAQKKLMNPEVDEADDFWDLQIFVPNYNYIVYHPTIDQAVQIDGFNLEDCDLNNIKVDKLSYRLDKSILYQNLFIFYDSKAAFVWLKANNPSFLTYLFVDYGYDKSDEINKMVLDQIDVKNGFPPSGNGYKNVFASRNKSGRLLIHQGLLQYMSTHANEKNLYFCMLDDYLSSLLEIERNPNSEGFTREERYEIGAYVGYYYGLMYDKCCANSCNTGAFDHFVYYNKDFVAYIKQNNYMGLKGYENIIQKAHERESSSIATLEHNQTDE